MDILIVGAGSIGVYLGTLLNTKDHNVFLLGRKKLKKLHETILIDERVYDIPKKIYSFPKNKSYDFIFITSKLYDLEKNLKKIVENNLKTKYLLSIQNGIVQNEVYEKFTNKFNFSSISVFEGFRIIENQLVVNQSKTGWKTDKSEAGIETSKLLKAAGINCSTKQNLESIKAEKTIMNCCVNILSAIKKKTFFELYRDPTTKKIMGDLFDESYLILSKEYDLRSKEELRQLFYKTIKSMKHYSSTYQDAILNKKTEVRFLNGLILKLAKKYKLQTPTNKHILEKFRSKYPKSN